MGGEREGGGGFENKLPGRQEGTEVTKGFIVIEKTMLYILERADKTCKVEKKKPLRRNKMKNPSIDKRNMLQRIIKSETKSGC